MYGNHYLGCQCRYESINLARTRPLLLEIYRTILPYLIPYLTPTEEEADRAGKMMQDVFGITMPLNQIVVFYVGRQVGKTFANTVLVGSLAEMAMRGNVQGERDSNTLTIMYSYLILLVTRHDRCFLINM